MRNEHILGGADLLAVEENSAIGVKTFKQNSSVLRLLCVKGAGIDKVLVFDPFALLAVVAPVRIFNKTVAKQIGMGASGNDG
ncbi:MAG: hypothetical protein IKV00_01040 [Clostridia bacterium]|nr:hypothetical protein [Clostridia bacterium]